MILSSGERGIKAVSFVQSKTVYLAALEKQFWSVPNKTTIMRGEKPVIVKKKSGELFRKKNPKNPILVIKSIKGVIIAVVVQPRRRIEFPEIKREASVAKIPVQVVT